MGRSAELAEVRLSIAAARRDGARLIWVEGAPGSGKTALAGRVVEELAPGSALWMTADEQAVDRPFSVTAQVGVGGEDGSFAAGLALVDRFGQSGAAGVTLVVVEDLHWADRESRLALLTAVHRLDRDQVVMLVTSRPDPRTDDGWDHLCQDERRCRRLVLDGLNPEDVMAMGRRAGVPLATGAARRLHRHTGGHPLYVRTLLREVPPARLLSVDDELPVPRTLEATILARLAAVPDEARALAGALSVVGEAVPLSVAGRVAGVGQPAEALESLLSTGFVNWTPGDPQAPVRVAHPLFRAAIYGDLSPTERRRLHRAAAGLLDAGSSLAHRVAAADGADDDLAGELAEAADREQRRGARALAARYLLWASSLCSQRQRTEEWLLGGVRLLLADGQISRAIELRDRVERCGDGQLRSLVLGMVAWEQGESAVAEKWLLEAASGRASSPIARDAAAVARSQLGSLYCTHGRGREAIETASLALAQGVADEETEAAAWMALVLGEAIAHGAPAGLARLAERLPGPADAVRPADTDLLVVRGTLGFYAGRVSAAIADLRVAIRLARQGAAAAQLPRAHLQLAQLLLSAGNWDDALVHADLALSLVADEHRVWMEAQAHAALGRLFAGRGQWSDAREHVAAARRAASSLGTVEAVFTARIAEAAMARAEDDPIRVVDALAPLVGEDRVIPMATSLAWWPTLITALIESRQLAAARTHLERLERAAQERGLDLRARITGGQALLLLADGDVGVTTAGLAEAVGLLGPDDPLLDRAALHHSLGRVLLAQGRRRSALDELRAARDLLAGAGAEPFVGRVDADLRSAGISAAPRRSRSPLDLTDRERDVVALVARGLTNREVGAELYIGAKTVDYHLRQVFAKLGVTSRRELRSYLAK